MVQQQYELVRQSREVLLQYCGTMAAAHFCTENSSFGRGSIRNLLVHIGNTYESWLGKQALRKPVVPKPYAAVEDVQACRQYFGEVDLLVAEFLSVFKDGLFSDLEVSVNDTPAKASPLKLFTHVIMHEYHHKGQVLSLSRHLGYTPVDTDIMR